MLEEHFYAYHNWIYFHSLQPLLPSPNKRKSFPFRRVPVEFILICERNNLLVGPIYHDWLSCHFMDTIDIDILNFFVSSFNKKLIFSLSFDLNATVSKTLTRNLRNFFVCQWRCIHLFTQGLILFSVVAIFFSECKSLIT